MAIKRDQHKAIQSNIGKAVRPPENISNPSSRAFNFTEKTAPSNFFLNNIRYSGIVFNLSQSLGSFDASGNTAYTFTSGNIDSGASGESVAVGAYTDTSKEWTIDEWADSILSTDDGYFRIKSNTASTLTLYDGTKSPEDGSYNLVPHEPFTLTGLDFVPHPGVPASFKIATNDENIITLKNELASVYTGVLSVSFGFIVLNEDGVSYVCPVDNILNTSAVPFTVPTDVTDEDGNLVSVNTGIGTNSFTGTDYQDFVNWYIYFTDGDAVGETGNVTAYSGGAFTITGLTGVPTAGDSFILQADLNSFSITDAHIDGAYDLFDSDFDDQEWEDLQKTYIISTDGDFHLDQATKDYNSRYTVEYYAKNPVTIPVSIISAGTVRVSVNNVEQLNSVDQGSLQFSRGWNRVDLYYFTSDGGSLHVEGVNQPIGHYFTQWRDPSPAAPLWVSTSGYSGVSAQEGQVELSWNNTSLLGVDGGTEIFYQVSGDAEFTFLDRVTAATQSFTHVGLDASTTYVYKLRHYTAQGDLSSYSDERNAVVASDVPADGVILEVDVTDSDLYYRSGEVVHITVESPNRLDSLPAVTVDGTPATFVSTTDPTDHTYTVWSFIATASDGTKEIAASGTTALGSSVTGAKDIVFDSTAPVVVSGDIVLDSNSNVGDGTVLYCTDPEQVSIKAINDISDSSGVPYLRLLNAFFGVASSPGSGTIKDGAISSSDFNSVSFSGYIFTDSAGDEFTVQYYNNDGGLFTWHLSGTPAIGAYTVSKYSIDSTTSWTEIDFTQNNLMSHSLFTDTPWGTSTIPDSMLVSNGFRVYMAAVDTAGNVSAIISDDIYYNTQATNSAVVSFKFVDSGSTEIFPNENGWFNDAVVRLEITATTNGGVIEIESIFYSIDGGAFTESVVNSTTGTAYASLVDESEDGTIEFYATTKAMSGPLNTTQVNYKWDKTVPTWTPATITPVGGFNRVILGWANDATDALSGLSHIEIYRHTSDASGSASVIAITDYSYKGFIDTLASTLSQDYYYWGKAVDLAGNKSSFVDLGGPVQVAQIVPADVDGALRIQNPYNTPSDEDEWQVRYGIRVPIEAVTFKIDTLESGEFEIDAITGIQYSENGTSWTNISNPTFNGDGITLSSLPLSSDTTYTIAFDPVQDAYYWRIVFNGPGNPQINSQISDVDFNSILAADLIVAGVLRLETGLTVWSGSYTSGVKSGGGVGLDSAGLVLWDASGSTTVALYGAANVDGNIAVFGKNSGRQMFVTEDGDVLIDGGSLTVGSGRNIVLNSDFGAGEYYWTFGSGWARSTNTQKFGTHSAMIEADGGVTTTAFLESDNIEIDNGLDYMVSFYCDIDDYVSGNFNAILREYDSTGGYLAQQTILSTSGNVVGFSRADFTVTSFNASTKYIGVKLYGSYGPANPEFTAYVDGFQIEQVDNVDQEASAWRPAGYTFIDGNTITTGKIQSTDGKTYFDLDSSHIKMVDGSNEVELSASVGLSGSFEGNKTFDVGVKNGMSFFRGGSIYGRLARVPELATEFGFEVDSSLMESSSFGETLFDVKLFNGYIWTGYYTSGVYSYLKKIDRITGLVSDTYQLASGAAEIFASVGDFLWCGSHGGIAPSYIQRLNRFNPSTETFDVNVNLGIIGTFGSGSLSISGMVYDPVNERVWFTSDGHSLQDRLFYLDLSDNSIGYITIANTGVQSDGITFDGTYIWMFTSNSTPITTIHRITADGLSVQSTTVSSLLHEPSAIVYDGYNLWVGNRDSITSLHYLIFKISDLNGTPVATEFISKSVLAYTNALAFDGSNIYANTSLGDVYMFDVYTEQYSILSDITTSSSIGYGCYDGLSVWIAGGQRLIKVS